MTKIKDLVTVSVDNAFLLFPIDSERYELAGCVMAYNCGILSYAAGERFDTRDMRVRAFILETEENFRKAATAYARLFTSPWECLKAVDFDRAKRVIASFESRPWSETPWRVTGDYVVNDIVTELFVLLQDELEPALEPEVP